ncbi:MAG: SAM-dependent methyltransferase [Pseudomonadota bacterium]
MQGQEIVTLVEQASQLITQDDVIKAKELSERAYAAAKDEARRMARIAKQVEGGDYLVRKAHELQGRALQIETRVKIRLADIVDEAQDAGDLATRGRPAKNISGENVLKLDDAALSATDIHYARQLRDAERKTPGVVERAIAARLEADLEPTKAAVRKAIHGKSTRSKEERGDDFNQTVIECTRVLLGRERFERRVLEPACGLGALVEPLLEVGYDVDFTDLRDRGYVSPDGVSQEVGDFLKSRCPDERKGINIITNPPYAIANAFIRHALEEYRPRKMAMLLPWDYFMGADDEDRQFIMEYWPPATLLALKRRPPRMHAENWEGQKSGETKNFAWFIWKLRERAQRPSKPYGDTTYAWRADYKDFPDLTFAKPPLAEVRS